MGFVSPDCCPKVKIEPASGTRKINKGFLYQEWNLESEPANGKASYLSKDGKYTLSNSNSTVGWGKWYMAKEAMR